MTGKPRHSGLVIGLDIGTSATKAVAADASGDIVASVRAGHEIDLPRPGWAEMDAEQVWWLQSCAVLRQLITELGSRRREIRAVAVSGIGPCLLPCDAELRPLRPAILYGIDTRAGREITEIEATLGAECIFRRGGSALSSQAVGPKLAWLRRCEPEVWARTSRWFTASSFLVARLTGEYVLDHHTASQCDPLYDLAAGTWAGDWAELICPGLPLPELVWSDQVCGQVRSAAAAQTGLPAGTPVLGGTVDAWAEAASVGVADSGDLMVMYGSTMFMIGVTGEPRPHPGLWATAGLTQGASTLAAGMSTSGLLTTWISELTGRTVAELAQAAGTVPPGSEGLLLLPYFAGERSPLFDPGARGVAIGLELRHTPAHLMRAAYEAIAMGVRHNLENFGDVSGDWRLVAVGGGATDPLWPQIVSDVTGAAQAIPVQAIGASYGDALLAARAAGLTGPDQMWNAVRETVRPRPVLRELYDSLFSAYKDLYPATRPIIGRVAEVTTQGGRNDGS